MTFDVPDLGHNAANTGEASQPEPEAIISVSHLAKRYGSLMAVTDISFDVHRGEIFGLLGPNGAGKTTTVECIEGLRVRSGGTIEILGVDPGVDPHLLRPRIGAQLQESSLPGRMRVWEALRLFSSLLPRGPSWRDVMRQWGLDDKANAAFSSLSGGQRQRLLVALALINDPEVVFLDEMTTGLDPAARRATWELIRRVRAGGTTVVLVTHFMDEAEVLCDRLAIIIDGAVAAVGTLTELVAGSARPTVVQFSLAGRNSLGSLRAIPHVSRVERSGTTVRVFGAPSIVPYVGKVLVDQGVAPLDMVVHRPRLEDIYFELVDGGEA